MVVGFLEQYEKKAELVSEGKTVVWLYKVRFNGGLVEWGSLGNPIHIREQYDVRYQKTGQLQKNCNSF